MTKLDEIMNGEHEIKKLRIEGDTIGFDTEQDNNWNFTPRDIEYIIYNLQRTNQELIADNKELGRLYSRVNDEWLEINKRINIAIRTLETLKESARWERHLYEVGYLLDILRGESDGSNK